MLVTWRVQGDVVARRLVRDSKCEVLVASCATIVLLVFIDEHLRG